MENEISNGIKLTNAVYRLLEFFPEDPLKLKTKERALSIMENLAVVFTGEGWVSIGEFLNQKRERAKLQVLEDIEVLQNYFKTAKSAGWLNSMNFLIISEGYEKLKKQIGRPIVLEEPKPMPKGLIKQDLPPLLGSPKPDRAKVAGQSPPPPRFGGALARQNKILEFLQQNEKAQVMDLIKIMPDVTKRTIRRDLDELLRVGKIVRTGQFNQVVYKMSHLSY